MKLNLAGFAVLIEALIPSRRLLMILTGSLVLSSLPPIGVSGPDRRQ